MKYFLLFLLTLPLLINCASDPARQSARAETQTPAVEPSPAIPSQAIADTPPNSANRQQDSRSSMDRTIAPVPEVTTIAMYGNWCGPGHPKNINNALDPIDRLDAACMNHDICYATKGYLACDCDKTLNDEIKQDLNSGMYTLGQTLVARNIHRYFSASPCDGEGGAKIAPSRAAHRIYNRVKNKVNNIIDRVMPE